jgi:hypothetical protein
MPSVPSTYQENQSPNLVPRVFAVLALVVAAIVVIALIAGAFGGSSSSTRTLSSGAVTASGPKHDFCVVRTGDNFSTIAADQGVSTTRLRRLNPNLDPQALQPDYCIRLVADGCKELASGSKPRVYC